MVASSIRPGIGYAHARRSCIRQRSLVETKFVLKEALRGLVPDWVLSRKKQGFGVPVGRWLADGGIGLEPRADSRYSMTRPTLDRLLSEHKSASADHRFALWAQLVLQSAARGH